MSNDLDIGNSDNQQQLDEAKIDSELKILANNSLSIKDLKWKIIPIGYRYYSGSSKYYNAQTESKEVYFEVLELILTKNRFFNQPEMSIPIRLSVMGGSQDLQMMSQNFGILFDVVFYE